MNNYNDYVKHSKKITDVNMSMAVLGWDQETKMPKNIKYIQTKPPTHFAKV